MHNARKLIVALWLLVPWLVLAQPLPPLTRSVLTTNIPPFGLTGQALFRTTALPYLAWSNIVASGGDTVLSNYVVALSNLLWESDNIVSNYVNSVSNLANGGSGAYIKSLNGFGTNTTFRQSAAGNVPVTIIPAIGTTTNRLEVQDTNNNPKFVVDAQGHVGVGTNLPQALMEIVGTNGPSPYLFRIQNPMLPNGTNGFLYDTNGDSYVTGKSPTIALRASASSSASGGIAFLNNQDITRAKLVYNSLVGDGLEFDSGSTNLIYFSRAGQNGFGTNNPQSRLHVTADNSAALIAQFGTTNQPQLVCVDTNGHVGIGTNNPQAVLHVRGTNGPSQYIVQVENPMVAGASNTFLVATNGRVGIGRSAPGTALDVNGIVYATGFSDSNPSFSYGANIGLNRDSVISWAAIDASFANSTKDLFLHHYSGSKFAIMGTNDLDYSTSYVGIGTNSPQSALHVTANNKLDNVLIAGTTNRPTLLRLDTNGNSYLAGTFAPTNGIINQVSNSFTANLVIVTNNPQLYCVNGTNQLLTLPDVTKIPVGQVIRFSSTNGYCSYVITNATGTQTIRDGTSLSYSGSGVSSIAFLSDGAAWWIASKAKTIWPNASWSTSTNVQMAVTGSNYISYDTLETSNAQGITLTNGYQIYIRDPGQYMLTYSVVTQVGHNNDTNRVWLQQSGVNVPRSRTDVKIPSTTAQQTITVNYIVPVVTNLTWFALCVRSTDTGAQLVTGAGADATQPAMPSAIITVNKISDSFP